MPPRHTLTKGCEATNTAEGLAALSRQSRPLLVVPVAAGGLRRSMGQRCEEQLPQSVKEKNERCRKQATGEDQMRFPLGAIETAIFKTIWSPVPL